MDYIPLSFGFLSHPPSPLNIPLSLCSVFQGGPGSKAQQAGAMQPSGRHLLGFSPEAEVGPEPGEGGPATSTDRYCPQLYQSPRPVR